VVGGGGALEDEIGGREGGRAGDVGLVDLCHWRVGSGEDRLRT
jgi:hypothetical protein